MRINETIKIYDGLEIKLLTDRFGESEFSLATLICKIFILQFILIFKKVPSGFQRFNGENCFIGFKFNRHMI